MGKLEEANIQSSLNLKKKRAQVRDNVDLRINLTNVGKGSAKLVKIDEVAPRGFKVGKAPTTTASRNHA